MTKIEMNQWETKWNKLLTQLDVCQAINSSVLALSPSLSAINKYEISNPSRSPQMLFRLMNCRIHCGRDNP